MLNARTWAEGQKMAPALSEQHEYAKRRILEEKEERVRAKQIILQILKQAPGGLGKTKLFKAFWLAHLFYSKNSPGYLSAWQIIRLPHGPGIDRGNQLIIELKKSGDITTSHEPKGPYTETVCKLVDPSRIPDFPPNVVEAIREACEIVTSETAAQISDWSHEFSRSWNVTPNGKELDIYGDLIPDDIYEERQEKLKELNAVYDNLFQ
jgi:hypothetical protein